MPTHSCSADLTKSCCYKRLYVSHKTIAGRVRINGIRFDNGRSTLLGALHRCFDDLFRQSLSAQLPTNEKADQRPYLFRTFAGVIRTAKVTVCWPRGDRAPCNGLTFGIAEQPDWHVIADILLYCSFPIRTLSGFGTASPHHAPAVFWSTPALEQALEISPACSIYFVKLKIKHALHNSEFARSCNQCNGHEGQLRHVRDRSAHLDSRRAGWRMMTPLTGPSATHRGDQCHTQPECRAAARCPATSTRLRSELIAAAEFAERGFEQLEIPKQGLLGHRRAQCSRFLWKRPAFMMTERCRPSS
jgi:hypothetical protein